MKREIKQQIDMNHIVLTEDEKSAMRSVLVARIKNGRKHHSVAYVWQNILHPLRIAMAGFAGIVLVVSGMSYAAEHSLPGDGLYPIKVEVNERMRSWTAFSKEAEAEWNIVRTTRRLEEVEQLVASGSFSKDLQVEVNSRLEKNADEANETIAHLKKERITIAADTSARLESALRVHERALLQVAEGRMELTSQLSVILDTVRKKTESVSEIRKGIEMELAEKDSKGNSKHVTEQERATSTDSSFTAGTTTRKNISTSTKESTEKRDSLQ
jgi:hypothetical protein